MNGTTKKSVGALTVLLAVFGGVALLGTGAAAAVSGVQQLTSEDGGRQLDVQGVTELDLEVSAAAVTVKFRPDAELAELQIEHGSPSGWSLKRDGDTLEVRGPDRGFDFFRPDWLRGDERATLVLPERLHGLDADLTLQAGTLTVDGVFGELDLQLNAGSLSVNGEARALDAELNAGRADIDLRGVKTAEYTVAAGRMTSVLSTAPDEVSIEVSAGALNLTLPDVSYDLRRSVNAGSLDSDLAEDSSSRHRIHAEVSAGSVTLKPGRTAG
ncbi:DUF4097 family beta strand repeat-containing protein [Microbacterium suwonense]|uniref:Adhesin domain-containing protein n=1 Tax=Microbacterium suwonense TaxID=683047 RepID=A0ABN6X5G8_9MICO|nr:DUF4097 family beta strand repeat-containing protein [Microbacterium suwonense]BDZ39941.1 hypothetical protein GCM10025863_25550 [Microbacterium suwonense]